MKVCVYGLYHQGSVTAACLAALGIATVGVEDDPAVLEGLQRGQAPLFEPGLDDLLKNGLESTLLQFTGDLPAAVKSADLLWIAFDTPINEADEADVGFVRDRVKACFPHLRHGAVVIVTAQVPIGSVRELESAFATASPAKEVHFASAPENLRLGKAL